MRTYGIRISDSSVKISEILEEIKNGIDLSWCILSLDGTPDPEKGNAVNESKKGLQTNWDEILSIGKEFSQISEIVILGSATKEFLHRYDNDQDMYRSCEIVIELKDCAFWQVFSNNQGIAERLSRKFKEVKFLQPTDLELFSHACKSINEHLIGKVMDRTFNSIGSNVFFQFGKATEYCLRNGKKGIKKEWRIWLSWASWRICRHNQYIVGSGENPEVNIQIHLEQLLGKRFQSFQFLSQFLDVQFNFEDGYQITTFFNYFEEHQWLIFLPDKTEIVLDCPTKESIEYIQKLSKQLKYNDKYTKTDISLPEVVINDILCDEDTVSKFICANDFFIDLGLASWRLEKNNEYSAGRLDYYFGCEKSKENIFKSKLFELVGKKLRHIDIDLSGMDARFQFDDGYVLEVFTHSSIDPWKVCSRDTVLFTASIPPLHPMKE